MLWCSAGARGKAAQALVRPPALRLDGEPTRLHRRLRLPVGMAAAGEPARNPDGHRAGHGPGHGRLHVARTGAGPALRPSLRHLLPGRRRLRDADGPRAFKAPTAAETMTASPKEDPLQSSTGTVPGLALGVERVLRHCLEKSPEERFQSARDVAFDLEALSGVEPTGSGMAPARSLSKRRGRAVLLTARRASERSRGAGSAKLPHPCFASSRSAWGRSPRRVSRRTARPSSTARLGKTTPGSCSPPALKEAARSLWVV